CPQCGELMNRYNFGHTSGVIIDKCADHGVWFDRDELCRVVDFIQQGGLELSRQQEAIESTEKAREAQAQQRVNQISDSFAPANSGDLSDILYILGKALGKRL